MILCYIFQYYVDCYDTDKIGTKHRTGGISQWISWIRGVIHEPKNISPSQNNSSEHLDKLRTRRPLPRIICGGQTYNYVQIEVLTDPKRNKRVGDVFIFHEWTLGFHVKMTLRQVFKERLMLYWMLEAEFNENSRSQEFSWDLALFLSDSSPIIGNACQ